MNNYLTDKRIATALFISLAIMCPVSSVYAADEYFCEARQGSRNELAQLAESCSIGEGLWGKKPETDDGVFWIQCGLFPEPVSVTQAAGIYSKISTHVWLKPESNGYRCLIGPYDSFRQADMESKQVRQLPAYKGAFIRQVMRSGAEQVTTALNTTAPNTIASNTTALNTTAPNTTAPNIAPQAAPIATPIPEQLIVPKKPSKPAPRPEPEKIPYGYSYMTFGMENVSYEEMFPDANSKVSISSPILNTGGLFWINKVLDFSIDALATFSPQHSTEEWTNDEGTVYQTNELEYMKAATSILLHYKITPNWRIVTGPAFFYQTYTRSDKHNLTGYIGTVYREGETWEEASTDIYWDLGIAYEPGTLFTGSRWHKKFRVVAGMPIFSETENSRFSNAVFEDTGYRAYIDGSISYEVLEGVHLGLYAQYSYEKRFEADPEIVYYRNIDGSVDMGQAWLPEADTYAFRTGLQVLWKL